MTFADVISKIKEGEFVRRSSWDKYIFLRLDYEDNKNLEQVIIRRHKKRDGALAHESFLTDILINDESVTCEMCVSNRSVSLNWEDLNSNDWHTIDDEPRID